MSSSSFYPTWPEVLRWEGAAFTQITGDRGGATKYGLTYKFLIGLPNITRFDYDRDGLFGVADLKAMPASDAEAIYHIYVWHSAFETISAQPIATKHFLTAINMGDHAANLIVQRALNGLSFQVDIDGEFGPQTIRQLNAADPVKLLAGMRSEQEKVYRQIVAHCPEDQKFLAGWLSRARA